MVPQEYFVFEQLIRLGIACYLELLVMKTRMIGYPYNGMKKSLEPL